MLHLSQCESRLSAYIGLYRSRLVRASLLQVREFLKNVLQEFESPQADSRGSMVSTRNGVEHERTQIVILAGTTKKFFSKEEFESEIQTPFEEALRELAELSA